MADLRMALSQAHYALLSRRARPADGRLRHRASRSSCSLFDDVFTKGSDQTSASRAGR
jgi:hypothetical protein